MTVRQLEIENLHGFTPGRVVFQRHTLLVGGINIGKSTVCEALELREDEVAYYDSNVKNDAAVIELDDEVFELAEFLAMEQL